MSVSTLFNSPRSAMHTAFPVINEENGRKDKIDPQLYEENPALQEGLNCISTRDPIRLKLILEEDKMWNDSGFNQVPSELFQKLSDALKLAKEYKELIDDHVHERVAAFYLQAITCRNTPFHFAIPKTEGQYFTAPRLKLEDSDTEEQAIIPYEAAHLGTVPSLKVCDRDEHDQYLSSIEEELDEEEPEYFSFLRGSHSDTLNNSTNGLPDFVNKIDTLIDAKADTPDGLRHAAIALLNQVAQRAITPVTAVRRFLSHMEESLASRPERSKSLTPAKIQVIKYYTKSVQAIRNLAMHAFLMNSRHPLFDSLLNVNLIKDPPEDIGKIRQIVFIRKYELIRESMFSESKIQLQIDKKFPSDDPSRRHYTRCVLIYFLRNQPILRKILEKQFAISYPVLRTDPDLVARLQRSVQVRNNKLDALVKDVRGTVNAYQEMEHAFRAILFNDFRLKLRNYKRPEFTELMKEQIRKAIKKERRKPIPNRDKIQKLSQLPTSVRTLQRIENWKLDDEGEFESLESHRRKLMDKTTIKIFAKTLHVHKNHFYPSFFASPIIN